MKEVKTNSSQEIEYEKIYGYDNNGNIFARGETYAEDRIINYNGEAISYDTNGRICKYGDKDIVFNYKLV